MVREQIVLIACVIAQKIYVFNIMRKALVAKKKKTNTTCQKIYKKIISRDKITVAHIQNDHKCGQNSIRRKG